MIGHPRTMSGFVQVSQGHASIHAAIPWPRKMAIPKPLAVEHWCLGAAGPSSTVVANSFRVLN